jgi:DNA polymerase-1
MLWLIDASYYLFRAWHAPGGAWRDSEGWPTHAVHGYLHFLLGLLTQERPERIVVCFDEALASSFRNDEYPAYKANREPPDEALVRQFAHAKAATRALGVSVAVDSRYEADDLIATLTHRARAEGMPVTVVSVDKDMGQLLDAQVRQWDYGRAPAYGPEGVVERMGVLPAQVVDWLALVGDAIDNIPGVQGVGPKTAAQLLKHFGSLEAIYARHAEIPYLKKTLRGSGTLAAKLVAQRELAFLSQRLARLAIDAPVPAPEACRRQPPDLAEVHACFDQLGFGGLLRSRAAQLAR